MARGVAEAHGLAAGDRLLIDTARVIDTARAEEPLIWLLAPLSVGASIVLCANLDKTKLDERVETERVTRVFVG